MRAALRLTLCASETTGSGGIFLLNQNTFLKTVILLCLLLSLILLSSLLPLMNVLLLLLCMHFAFVSWEISLSAHLFAGRLLSCQNNFHAL